MREQVKGQELLPLLGVKGKEVLNMTVLGQMIMQDGMKKGIEKGEDRVNRLNQLLAKANRTEDIVKASVDREYQKKLFEEFKEEIPL